jgi:hypothetical protein
MIFIIISDISAEEVKKSNRKFTSHRCGGPLGTVPFFPHISQKPPFAQMGQTVRDALMCNFSVITSCSSVHPLPQTQKCFPQLVN